MTAKIERVEVTRRGTGLILGLAGSRSQLVRRVDLLPELKARDDRRRYDSARVLATGVEVDYDDGGQELIANDALLGERVPSLVIANVGQLLTADGDGDDPMGLERDAAVVCSGDKIAWIGPSDELERCGLDLHGVPRVDAAGCLVTPGLVDCHAHPIFAGNRADEFGRRAAGQSYLEIAAAGGGINATLTPTRAASFQEHVQLTAARMSHALMTGTTTCEAKSGYDLTVEGELRLLEVALAVDGVHPMDMSPTLLGAHLVPPERRDDRQGFVADVIEQMIPAAMQRQLAGTIDVYCDEGAFTIDETRAILTAARDAGMMLRAHVGQFADLGGPELLAELGGLSGDHLEQISGAGMEAMAAQGVVAVMLPGACVQLRMEPPPVAALRQAGVALAVASDMNPGTSSGETLPIQMWLASTHYGMTVEETWLGVTRIAARAMGRHDIGVLAVGATADFVVWDAELPAEIPYRYGANLAAQVIKRGRPVMSSR